MARPSKIKRIPKKTLDAICRALEMAATYEIAARVAGITYGTFNNWRLRGEAEARRLDAAWDAYHEQLAAYEADPGHVEFPFEPKPKPSEVAFLEFFNKTEEAIATCALGDLSVIEDEITCGKSAYWASWRLARRFPKEYGYLQRTEVAGPDGGPIKTETAQVIVTLPDNGRGDRQEDSAAPS